jgi:hypothetical protein
MLLALDNAEHLLADVARSARRCTTRRRGCGCSSPARRRLRLAAEQRAAHRPLAVPAAALPAQQALRFGAVAPVRRARAAVDRASR